MGNPYRKLFNLFAFSVLSLAIYLNFFHSDDDMPVQKSHIANYERAHTAAQSKPIVALQTSKAMLAKEEKKN